MCRASVSVYLPSHWWMTIILHHYQATTLQFAISFCFCVIVANIDFGEGGVPVSPVQHQKAND